MKKKITAILLVVALALSLGLVPAASVGANPGPDIVGLWHLDGDATDDSGNGNDGTEYGTPTYDSDQWTGQAIDFDGSDDGVSVADSLSLDFSTAITIEAWIQLDSYTMDHGAQAVAEKAHAYYLNIQSGKLSFYWYGLSDPGYHRSPNVLPLNTWTHVAATYDGSAVKLYENGVNVYSASVTGTGDTSDWPLGIGYEPYYPGRYFDGQIDEVRIWDTATPTFNFDADPNVDFNEVGFDHTVTATVTIDRVDDGEEVAPGVKVDFGITGPNSGESTTKYTQSDGVATLTYTSDGTAGQDSIGVSIDWDWSAMASETVTKYWLENFVTGGGKINCNNPAVFPPIPGGKKAALTFAGTVGNLEMGSVGQFQIVDHTGRGAEAWHCNNDFSSLVFSGSPIVGPPGPSATNDIATFTGTFTNNRNANTLVITVVITDVNEPGKGWDTIELDGSGLIVIDGGNFQVHDMDD